MSDNDEIDPRLKETATAMWIANMDFEENKGSWDEDFKQRLWQRFEEARNAYRAKKQELGL